MKDYYRILGVSREATEEEIRARWVELVKHLHPDLEDDQGDARIKEINEAYQALKNPTTRFEYDLEQDLERNLRKLRLNKVMLASGFLVLLLVVGILYLLTSEVPPVDFPRLPVVNAPEEIRRSESEEMTLFGSLSNPVEQEAYAYEPPPRLMEPKVQTGSERSEPKKRLTREKKGEPKTEKVPVMVPVFEAPKDIPAEPDLIKQAAIFRPPPEVRPRPLEPKLTDASLAPKPAEEEEVKQFLERYVRAYMEMDVDKFLCFFSPKAIQNQKEGFDEIRRTYMIFFGRSQELRYQLEDLKIVVHENLIEARANYLVDQTLRRSGQKKIWKGSIRWVLTRESGSLKIIQVDYKHQESI